MSTERSDDDRTWLARCHDPGFTPGARDVRALVDLWARARRGQFHGDDAPTTDSTRSIERALARGERGVARALGADWVDCDSADRAMRVRVFGRIGTRLGLPELPELPARLLEALRDPEPRVVREAARALGKLDGIDAARYEPELLRIAEHAALPEQRAAVDTLGRLGGDHAHAFLRSLQPDDPDLARRTAEAITLIVRRMHRTRGGEVVLDVPLPAPTRVWLRARGGATTVVEIQARTYLPTARVAQVAHDAPGVELSWSGPLEPLYQVRCATEVALVFPLPPGASSVGRIVTGLEQPPLIAALRAWTRGTPRFRLSFTGPGRRRAEIWEVARQITARGSPLVNDSREVEWAVEVDEPNGLLSCLPRNVDPRFTYRQRDVPAATHPTFAALLAWAGAPQPGEVVWDPFCGSGTELVEAVRLEPDLYLWGTDTSASAIAAARTNLAAAGLDPSLVHLERADALTVRPRRGDRPVTLILANPPMGRRVEVEGAGMRQLLDDFVAHAAAVLGPGGRMVWLSPAPRSTARAGKRRGLQIEDLEPIDMGGFTSTPQVLRRPA